MDEEAEGDQQHRGATKDENGNNGNLKGGGESTCGFIIKLIHVDPAMKVHVQALLKDDNAK